MSLVWCILSVFSYPSLILSFQVRSTEYFKIFQCVYMIHFNSLIGLSNNSRVDTNFIRKLSLSLNELLSLMIFGFVTICLSRSESFYPFPCFC